MKKSNIIAALSRLQKPGFSKTMVNKVFFRLNEVKGYKEAIIISTWVKTGESLCFNASETATNNIISVTMYGEQVEDSDFVSDETDLVSSLIEKHHTFVQGE